MYNTKIFWMIILIAAGLLVVCWIGYAIWTWRQRKLEKEQPRERSQRYKQAESSVADWAKQLAEFKPPKHQRPAEPDQNQPSGQTESKNE
jgi:membrane protein required for beta-lactamase induction